MCKAARCAHMCGTCHTDRYDKGHGLPDTSSAAAHRHLAAWLRFWTHSAPHKVLQQPSRFNRPPVSPTCRLGAGVHLFRRLSSSTRPQKTAADTGRFGGLLPSDCRCMSGTAACTKYSASPLKLT